jgi:hypothetical protein
LAVYRDRRFGGEPFSGHDQPFVFSWLAEGMRCATKKSPDVLFGKSHPAFDDILCCFGSPLIT